MSKYTADVRTARRLGLTVAAVREYRRALAPIDGPPAAFIRWLAARHFKGIDHAPPQAA
jgi:hypothetical protein